MASYLRPRRGKKATAIAQLTASAPLKRGEVFFEVPDAGTGTGAGKIKMGDGSTAYESLPYFLEPFDPDSATVGFTDATEAEADPYTSNATHTNAIVPAANFKTIFTNLKQLLLNYNSQFTKLNNDLENINGKLNGYPSKLSQPYKTNNESHTFPIEALSLFFITYGTNDIADVYLCRCESIYAHALVPLHTSNVIAQRYDIKLDIAARAVTIISKVSWVQVDIINL